MAASGDDSIHEVQRRMMQAEVAADQRNRAAAARGRRAAGPQTRYPPGYPAAQRAGSAAGPTAVQRGRPSTALARREGFCAAPLGSLAATSAPPAGATRPGPIDTHELLKQQMFGGGSPLEADHFEKNRPAPATIYGVSDQYITLDSFLKVIGSKTYLGEYDFNIMVEGAGREQSVAASATLENLIEIQVCKFCIPLLPLDDYDPASLVAAEPGLAVLNLTANGPLPAGDAVSNPQSQVPFCGRVTLQVKEFGRQCFIDHLNKAHQFEFQASVVPDEDRIELTPLPHCQLFQFTDPIKEITSMSLQFNNPDQRLVFPPDVLYDPSAQTNGAQLLQFNASDQYGLNNLAVGDRIYIVGFKSGVQSLDRYLARPAGHIVGAGGFVPNVSFRLNPDVDLSAFFAANAPVPSAPFVICIAKNRIRIPFRLRRVVGRLTNYKAP